MTVEIPKDTDIIEIVGLKEWLTDHDKQIRAEVVEESVERVDRLMINTVCNPLISTREKIDAYLQCIRDAKKAIRGESDDN